MGMPENSGIIQEKLAVLRNPDGTFPKGVSGNPDGPKPGYKHMTTKLMEAITRVSEGGGDSDDAQIIKALVEGAKKGQDRKIELVMSYIDGKPKAAEDDLGTVKNPIHTVHSVKWE